MQIAPSETYKELLKQFKSLLQMYNRQEEMFLIQQKKLSDTKAQLAFITQIMDDLGDVIPKIDGYVWYENEYYESVAELLHMNVGVEFGEGEDNDSTVN